MPQALIVHWFLCLVINSWMTGYFFFQMIFFLSYVFFFYLMCIQIESNITIMKLSWKSDYWVKIDGADSLVLQHQGISTHNADQHLSTHPGLSPNLEVNQMVLSLYQDTLDGFFKPVDEQIQQACDMIGNDTKLQQGYNAVGFSQGGQFLWVLETLYRWLSAKELHLFYINLLILLMLEMNILALGVNSMPADALAPKVARVSAGMVLAV